MPMADYVCAHPSYGCAPQLLESRPESLIRGLDVSSERRTNMARKNQRARQGSKLQHHAAALPRLLDVGILRKIPMRVVDLQKMMEHVADENGTVTRAFKPKHHMARRVSRRRNNLQELVEPVRPGDKVGMP